jgi:RNA polymerase sigma factor (TIGR02999 family)
MTPGVCTALDSALRGRLGLARFQIPVNDTPPPPTPPLKAPAAGDAEAHSMATLLPLVYKELRAMAADQLKRRPGHTIQPTALVHEAYIKMAGPDKAWASREHFMATAATAMRHVLIDRLRSKSTDKRGGGIRRADIEIESLAGDSAGGGLHGVRVLELDELLTELAKADARAAQAAEMRLFGGMDQESIARVQGVSRTIVSSDWQFTRAWLASRMHDSQSGNADTSGGSHAR